MSQIDTRQNSIDSPRLFENAFLEKFSRAHPRLPIVLYGPCIAFLSWVALRDVSVGSALLYTLAGYLAWTLTEYFGHRFLFHLSLPGVLGARLHFLIHGVHHEFPNDPWRLVMPPLMSLPVLGAAGAIIWAIVEPAHFAPVMAGYGLGYVFYDTLHYEVHHREQRTRVGRWLKRRHMLHHYRDHTRGYGISCPWWDLCFGTTFNQGSALS